MEEKNAALNERIDIAKIGRRIMAMRLANGMTRAELAEKVEKSNQTLASIEYGHKGMSLQTLCSICYALEVTPNYILGWSRYPIEGNEEYSQACEEISEMLKACSPSQMKTISTYHFHRVISGTVYPTASDNPFSFASRSAFSRSYLRRI